jgi:putative phosphoribosyl transferase
VIFVDRVDAGRQLAKRLSGLPGDVRVLGLPRGGVPVALEVAKTIDAPLDVIVVRKLGVPWQPELAMGAVGEDGVRVTNDEVVRQTKVSEADLVAACDRERREVERRARQLRGSRERVSLDGCTAVIVDDGIATGATARAACEVARAHGASRIVLAVPVAPADSIRQLREVTDDVVCLQTPDRFLAVGRWYSDFRPTTDADVAACLAEAAALSARGDVGGGEA